MTWRSWTCMPVTVKLSQPAFTVDNRVDLCRAATVADADRLTSPPLSRSPRGELFTRGYRSNRGCRVFGHSGGKHTFRCADGIISRHITALACVPAKSPHGHAPRRMELSHSSYIHQRGRSRPEKRRPTPRIVNIFLCRPFNDLFNSRSIQIQA